MRRPICPEYAALLAAIALIGAPRASADALADSPPPALEPRPFSAPVVEQYTLSNGIPVVLLQDHSAPLVWLRVESSAGSWTDPDDMAGLAWAAMRMMRYRTDTMEPGALRFGLERHGITLDSDVDHGGARLVASCLRDGLEPMLDVVATAVQEPSYWPLDWKRARRRQFKWLQEDLADPEFVARRVLDSVLYEGEHGWKPVTADSLVTIHIAAMRSWADAHVNPATVLIAAGGDVTLEELVPLLEERLGNWTPADPVHAPAATFQQPDATTVYVVDLPDAPQSAIALGRFVTRREDPDHAAVALAHAALAGYHGSRLNLVLREQHGWTYGVGGTVGTTIGPGRWRTVAAVDRAATAEALATLVGEVRAAQDERPLTDEELDRARARLIGAWIGRFETPEYALSVLAERWRHGLPVDWMTGYAARLRAVSADDANAALAAHLDPDAMAIVVAGDLATVREPLEALGWPVVALDVNGDPVD